MLDPAKISVRCAKIAHDLDAPSRDPVSLLRTARILKGVHSHLTHSMVLRARSTGWTNYTQRAGAALDLMEQDLRRVLLEYASLDGARMHEELVHALHQSIQTLDLLGA